MKIFKKVLLVILFFIILFVLAKYSGNWVYNMKINGISKDIVIIYNSSLDFSAGYASSLYEYYIDREAHCLYRFEDYHVYGNTPFFMKGDHKKVEKVKDLTDEDINHIISIYENNAVSPEEIKGKEIKEFGDKTIYMDTDWFEISYNGETRYIPKNNSDDLSEYANSINYNRSLP